MSVRFLCKITDRILLTEVGVRMPVVDVLASDGAMAYECCISLTLFLERQKSSFQVLYSQVYDGQRCRSKRFRQDVVEAERRL